MHAAANREHPDHAAWLAKERRRQAAYREKNREQLNKKKRERYTRNAEREKERARRWFANNKSKIHLSRERYVREHPMVFATRNKRIVDDMTDAYVAKLSGVSMYAVSKEWLVAKRAILAVKRMMGVTGLSERRKHSRYPSP